jgi:hypothetical protein
MTKTTVFTNGSETITLVSNGYKQMIKERNEVFTDTRVNAITMLRKQGFNEVR